MSVEPILELNNVIKIYQSTRELTKIPALQGCDLVIRPGEIVSIIGPSGSGKTTLLNVIAGIEPISSGSITIGGYNFHNIGLSKRTEFRRKYIGTFTQFGRENLEPKMTVFDAISWDLRQAGWGPIATEEQVKRLLSQLEMDHLRERECGKLSAGEAMRVSLLKAVAKKPLIILADEPTGQLDTQNMQNLFELMKDLIDDDTAILVATHDVRFQTLSDRSLLIMDGKLASEEDGEALIKNKLAMISFVVEFEGPINSRLFIDSTNSIRIPTAILQRLEAYKMLTIEQEPGTDYAILRRAESDHLPQLSDIDELIQPYSREIITDKLVLDVEKLSKTYYGKTENQVLKDINLKIQENEFVVLLGPSGSGKTTLLNIIAGLETVTDGSLTLLGDKIVKSVSDTQRDQLVQNISYLTQNYTVHPYLSVEENAMLPSLLKGNDKPNDLSELHTLLEALQILELKDRYPVELSGGQQQRSSLAASLLKDSPILVLDEPTANLDGDLAIKVMDILTEIALERKTVIMATHDFMIIRPGYRVIRLKNKKIEEDVIADEKYCIDLQTQYLKYSSEM